VVRCFKLPAELQRPGFLGLAHQFELCSCLRLPGVVGWEEQDAAVGKRSGRACVSGGYISSCEFVQV